MRWILPNSMYDSCITEQNTSQPSILSSHFKDEVLVESTMTRHSESLQLDVYVGKIQRFFRRRLLVLKRRNNASQKFGHSKESYDVGAVQFGSKWNTSFGTRIYCQGQGRSFIPHEFVQGPSLRSLTTRNKAINTRLYTYQYRWTSIGSMPTRA